MEEQTLPRKIISDSLLQAFFAWRNKKWPDEFDVGEELTLCRFMEWLVLTGDGSVALKQINETPRQLFLDFGD